MSHYVRALLSLVVLMLGLNVANVFAQTETVTTTVPVTTTTTTPTVIVTPAPAPKEVVVVPTGYSNCFNVDAGWFNGVWIPKHQVCQYPNASQGVSWVEGYWSCNKYDTSNVCTNWIWVPAHWAQTLEVY